MEVVAHKAPRGGDKFLSVNQTHIHFDPNRKSVNFPQNEDNYTVSELKNS
jgi:hypothetical protein